MRIDSEIGTVVIESVSEQTLRLTGSPEALNAAEDGLSLYLDDESVQRAAESLTAPREVVAQWVGHEIREYLNYERWNDNG